MKAGPVATERTACGIARCAHVDLPSPWRYRDRLRVWESNYGRSDGRDLEPDGKPVAFMDGPRQEGMFWVSYRTTPTTDDPAWNERLTSESFWEGEDWSDLAFRSRATGLVAANAFPSGPFVAAAGEYAGVIHRRRRAPPVGPDRAEGPVVAAAIRGNAAALHRTA